MRRRCCRPCSYRHDAATNYFSGSVDRTDKEPSSKWIKTLDARYRGFSWQRGYAAFSVSQSQLKTVVQYAQRQEEHHRNRTFQEEYRELLRLHGIEFDEQYVWD